jgi:hypothetical protein
MRKLILIALIFIGAISVNAQVFNSDANLRKGGFGLGVEPAIFIHSGANEFLFFIHGEYGIKSGIALDLHAGLGNPTYFGADLRWSLLKYISLNTGAHFYGSVFGIDGRLNIAIPIKSDIRLLTGADINLDFLRNSNTFLKLNQVPFWIPIGVDLGLRKNIAFILEAEIGLTNSAYHVIGGGLVFYF